MTSAPQDPWTLRPLILTAYIMSGGANEVLASHINDDDHNNVDIVTLPTAAETATQNMARTLQTARLSTGGKAPRKMVAMKKQKQTARKSSASTSGSGVASADGNTIVVTSAELIPRVPKRRKPPLPHKSVAPGLRRSSRLRERAGGNGIELDTTASSSSTTHPVDERPFYPAGNDRPRPFLPFARFDDDPDLLSSIQDLNVPLLENAEWQPHSNAEGLRGGFGYVERASWNKQNVAVKFLKSSQTVSGTARGKKSFRRELDAWRKLAHPNILPFIGVVCVDNMYLGMVSPYMSNGSAPKYLTNNPDADVLQILHDVAKGMSHLGSQKPPIAHGDLKGANVLIDQDGRACICDFGLSRFMKDFMSIDTTFGGTIRWMAPEQLRAETMIVSLPADIFSWGMLALELISGTIPWPEVQQDSAVILKVAARGLRPGRPGCVSEQCPASACECLVANDALWELVQRCWEDAPEDRPNTRQLCELLAAMNTGEAKGAMMVGAT